MGYRRKLDVAGLCQVAVSAAALAAVAVSIASLSTHADLLPAVVIGLVGAFVGGVVPFWEWDRLGGRITVIAVNSWIRAGAIPSAVSPDTWVPLLRQREARATKGWGLLVLAGVEVLLSWLMLSRSSTTAGMLLWSCVLVFWAGAAVWTAYYNLRFLPVIRSLLRLKNAVPALRRTENEPAPSRG